MHLRMMELGLHHSRSGQDECTLYFFSFVVHLVMDLWYTCDALVDFDGLVMDLWIYLDILEHLLLYMWYILWWMCGWMRYICDEWDIYMWWMRYMIVWIYLSWWNVKKIKNYRFGSVCRVLHSAKDPVAECHGHSTRQSWKNGCSENHFSSFAECHDQGTRHGTRQRFFLKKI